jgi:hypothetical protein
MLLDVSTEVRKHLVDSALDIICEATNMKRPLQEDFDVLHFEGLPVFAVNEINRTALGVIDNEQWNNYPGNRVFLDLFSQYWFEASNLKWIGYIVTGSRHDARVTFDGFTIEHEVQNAEDHKRYHELFMEILSYGPDEQNYTFDGKNLRLYVWWD